ncbi:DEAD/DEAH box helicase [Xanthocytophaga flava]|uniref:DEAD/DEAH box helicase n=1 Tax=Xanthocytophaga flava TaxID=3048013 RepID=UPI0028D453E7|nr:DEAD/DEAH box helicase [Xanthocytophaga flavus]MDJ1467286.1 DEAD/DEAH box helicase [Xanthocytophaga flavus]
MQQTDNLTHATSVNGEALPLPASELPKNKQAFSLRDYQESSITELTKRHQSGASRLILCLPTGAGKTVTFAEMTRHTLETTPKARVLILVDRMELLHQAAATLERYGLQVGIVDASSKQMPTTPVIVAMAETYYRRVQKGWSLPDLKLLIIDEAHKGNFRKVIQLHPDTPIVGATATPLSASKRIPLNTYFNDIVVGTQIHSLIEAGHLALPRYFAVPMEIKAGRAFDGDYKINELYADFDKPALYQGCVSNWQKHAEGKKTVIFCVNKLHTLRTTQAFLQVHDQVRYITSDTPTDERHATLQWFAYTPDAILVNCGILTTGFDEPTIECIVLNRATRSLSLYLQMCGRGSRTTATKEEFIIIDMGNNIRELGFWHEPYNWESIFRNGYAAVLQHAPVKSCPECQSIVALSTQTCPYCQHTFKRKLVNGTYVYEVETQEIVVDWTYLMQKEWHTMNVIELIMRASMGDPKNKRKQYPVQWIISCILKRDNPRPMLEEFARLRGYQSHWVDYTLKAAGISTRKTTTKTASKGGKR